MNSEGTTNKSGLSQLLIVVAGLIMLLTLGGLLALMTFNIIQSMPAYTGTPLIVLPLPGTNPQLTQEFQDASTDFERALSTINLWTGFIQIFSVLLTLGGAGLAALGVKSYAQIQSKIQDIEELKQSVTKQSENTIKSLKENARITSNSLSLVQFAQQQLSLNNLYSARDSLELARALDLDNPILNYFLGDVYLRLGEYQDAEKYLKRAIEQAMESKVPLPSAEASYAYLLRLEGDLTGDDEEREDKHSESKLIFRNLYKKHPHLIDITGESVYGALASLYRRGGDDLNAIKWYEICYEVTPSNTYPLNNLALLQFKQPEPQMQDEARQNFTQVKNRAERKLAFDDEDYWASFDLVTAQIALGEDYTKELDNAFRLTKDEIDPLEKLCVGLQMLQNLPNSPEKIDEIIDKVESELKKRRNKKKESDTQAVETDQ